MPTVNSWAVNADGDWSVAANWSLGRVPNSNDNVVIDTPSRHTITHGTGDAAILGQLAVGNDLFVLSGGTLAVLPTARFAGGFARFGSGFTQTGGVLDIGMVWTIGPVTLAGGAAAGRTVLRDDGRTTIADYTLGGSARLDNAYAVDQTGVVTLGDDTGLDAPGVSATINNRAGAIYRIVGDKDIIAGAAGARVTNAGTIIKTAGAGIASIGADVTSTGTITAASGTLELDGASNRIAGTLSGAGAIAFGASGSTMLTLGTATLGMLVLSDSAHLTLTGPASRLHGTFADLTNGTTTLDIGNGSLTLAGPSMFESAFGEAYVTGTGRLVLEGSTNAANAQFGGRLAVTNTGVFDQAGVVMLGDVSAGPRPVTFTNDGTYALTTNDRLARGSSLASSFVNNGTFAKVDGSGTSEVSVVFANDATGVINVGTSTIAFDGSLVNAGGIEGIGTVEILGSGAARFNAGSTMTVAEFAMLDRASLSLGGSLTYSGTFLDHANGTLALGANALTLNGGSIDLLASSGTVAVTGHGKMTLDSAGSAAIGSMLLGSGEKLVNNGNVAQTGTVTLGESGGPAANIINNGSWVTQGGAIEASASGSQFTNAGVLRSSHLAPLDIDFVNTGLFHFDTLRTSGEMQLFGTVEGTDLQLAGSGHTTFAISSSLSLGTLEILNAATLTLTQDLQLGSTFVDRSDGGTVIDIGQHTLQLGGHASFAGSSTPALVTGSGTLELSDTTDFGPNASVSGLVIGGTAQLVLNDYINASGNLQLGDSSGGAVSAVLKFNALYILLSDSAGISRGSSLLSNFDNRGIFDKEAGTGTSVVSAKFTNDGLISVETGTIEFTGGFTNSGTILGHMSTDSDGNVFISHV